MRIVIDPELPIGTPFWIMRDNKPEMGLICAYDVHVTSHTDNRDSWHSQLFRRWVKSKQLAKETFKYYFSYEAKIDHEIFKFDVKNKGGIWYLSDRQMFFSKDDLLNNL